MIAVYDRVNDFVAADLLLSMIPERNMVSWNTMIAPYVKLGDMGPARRCSKKCWRKIQFAGYVKCEDFKGALDIFENMKINGVVATEITLTLVLGACAEIRDFVIGSREALSKITANRLQKELPEWQMNPPFGFKHKVTDNLQRWIVEVNGASGTLYSNETYQLQVDFPEHYPMEAPQVIFIHPAPSHPHIYNNGHICLEGGLTVNTPRIYARLIWSVAEHIDLEGLDLFLADDPEDPLNIIITNTQKVLFDMDSSANTSNRLQDVQAVLCAQRLRSRMPP
ncbi:hypothetical protein GIB67_006541 [Kingdonia uniflora]|uniref:UBC core domain-containing protein n=1 Tax=Kingdonia uniflora TaxID=39325 RepID=A0A7J7LEL8_9MAGN|nr:hypothetical protein GIB67_006541 [Kingdonia uniflora]